MVDFWTVWWYYIKKELKMLGDCKKNKWCCFCKNWFDPSCSALKPRLVKDMFDVDTTKRFRCLKKAGIVTPALYVCKDFERKFT